MTEEEKKEIALQEFVEEFFNKQEVNTLGDSLEERDYLTVFEAVSPNSANNGSRLFSVEEEVIIAIWNKEEKKLIHRQYIVIALTSIVIFMLLIISSTVINAPLITLCYNYILENILPIFFLTTVIILAGFFEKFGFTRNKGKLVV